MRHKISVIIPCYNCAEYINKCLSALDRQTFKEFEVILVNDCSTDDTEKIIRTYAESSNLSIKILSNSRNLGPALSRKRGLIEADSEFICFCDSDDWYDVNFLADFIEHQSKQNADITFCGHKLVFENGKILERPIALSEKDLTDIRQVLVKSNDSLCMLMVRLNLIKDEKFPDLRNGEDMALVPILISKSNTFAIVDKCDYNYYCRSTSASQNANFNQINSLLESFTYIESHLKDSFPAETEYLGIRNLLYGAMINVFKFTSNPDLAKGILNDFERKYPSWHNNKYIGQLSFPKRIFLRFASLRLYPMMRLMSNMHKHLSH